MGKVRVIGISNARGFYNVTTPRGIIKVGGKENAVEIARANRRLIQKNSRNMKYNSNLYESIF